MYKVQKSSKLFGLHFKHVQCLKTATPATAKSPTLRQDGALLVANAFKLLLFPGKNHFGREDVLSGIDESDVFVQRYPGICHGLHMLASSFGRGFLPNMLAPSCRLKNPAKYSSTYTFAAIRNSAQFYIYIYIQFYHKLHSQQTCVYGYTKWGTMIRSHHISLFWDYCT